MNKTREIIALYLYTLIPVPTERVLTAWVSVVAFAVSSDTLEGLSINCHALNSQKYFWL